VINRNYEEDKSNRLTCVHKPTPKYNRFIVNTGSSGFAFVIVYNIIDLQHVSTHHTHAHTKPEMIMIKLLNRQIMLSVPTVYRIIIVIDDHCTCLQTYHIIILNVHIRITYVLYTAILCIYIYYTHVIHT